MKFILGKKCKQLCRVNQLCKAVCESHISLNLLLRHELGTWAGNTITFIPAEPTHLRRKFTDRPCKCLYLKENNPGIIFSLSTQNWIPLLALSPKITPGLFSLLQEFISIYHMPNPVLSSGDQMQAEIAGPSLVKAQEFPLSRKSTSTGFAGIFFGRGCFFILTWGHFFFIAF